MKNNYNILFIGPKKICNRYCYRYTYFNIILLHINVIIILSKFSLYRHFLASGIYNVIPLTMTVLIDHRFILLHRSIAIDSHVKL